MQIYLLFLQFICRYKIFVYLCSVQNQKLEIMKQFIIEYKRENGTTDKETVFCKTSKLTKSIRNYFFHINAEILNVY